MTSARLLVEGLEERILLQAGPVGMETYTVQVPSGGGTLPAGSEGTYSLPQFDNQGGTRTLAAVTYQVAGYSWGGINILDNESAFAEQAWVRIGALINVTPLGAIQDAPDVQPRPPLTRNPAVGTLAIDADNEAVPPAPEVSGDADYAGTDSIRVDGVDTTDTPAPVTLAAPADDLSGFIGTGTIDWHYEGLSGADGNAGTASTQALLIPAEFSLEATVTYTWIAMEISKGVVAREEPRGDFSPLTVGPVVFNAPGTVGARFAGTITSANLQTNPVDSNLWGLPADDYGGKLITFAIVLQNLNGEPVSNEGVFDVRVWDTIPKGLSIPTTGLNLYVTDGTGAVIPFTDGAGGAFQDADLFTPGLGIELVDPGPTAGLGMGGALDPYDANSGRNIAVITYDLQLNRGLPPGWLMINTATLYHGTWDEGQADQIEPDLRDPALVHTWLLPPPPNGHHYYGGTVREIEFPKVRVFQPLFTGTAEPGSTLLVEVYDRYGNLVGSESTLVDAGGNWSTNFFNTYVTIDPYTIILRQTYAGHSPLYDAGYNLRMYFQPAIMGGSFASEHLTVENVLGNRAASRSLNALYAAGVYPLLLGWNAYAFEFLSAAPTSAQR